MAKQIIDIGSAPNDGTGDAIRDAFDKCNDNFTELYASANVQSGDGSDVGVADTEKTITFGTAFADTSYSLCISCYTAAGLMVGFTRGVKTKDNFKITPVADCTIEWVAK